MAGLVRSETSFRRQGSSGLVWDDKILSGELKKLASQKEGRNNIQQHKSTTAGKTVERSRSTGGGRGYRTDRVSPAIEPPSPKVSACGFCSAFGKHDKTRRRVPPKSGKRKM